MFTTQQKLTVQGLFRMDRLSLSSSSFTIECDVNAKNLDTPDKLGLLLGLSLKGLRVCFRTSVDEINVRSDIQYTYMSHEVS